MDKFLSGNDIESHLKEILLISDFLSAPANQLSVPPLFGGRALFDGGRINISNLFGCAYPLFE